MQNTPICCGDPQNGKKLLVFECHFNKLHEPAVLTKTRELCAQRSHAHMVHGRVYACEQSKLTPLGRISGVKVRGVHRKEVQTRQVVKRHVEQFLLVL